MHRFHWTEHVERLRLRRSLVMSYFELISKRNFEEKKIKPGLSNARMRQFVKIMKNCEIRMKWKGSKYFTWSTLGQILWHILNMFWTIEIRVTVIDAFGKNWPYIIKTRRKEKRKHSIIHIIHWCCRLEKLLKTSPLVQLGSTLYLPQILSQKSRKKSRSSCKPVKLEMTGPNESGSFIIYFATPMKVCYRQASYQIVNLVTISLEQAFFLGHHQTNMTIILMLRIIPSNIITAPNGLTQNVLRKRGPLTKPWVMTHDIPWHSKYSLCLVIILRVEF